MTRSVGPVEGVGPGLLEKLKPGTLNKPVINKGLLKFDDSSSLSLRNYWKLPSIH